MHKLTKMWIVPTYSWPILVLCQLVWTAIYSCQPNTASSSAPDMLVVLKDGSQVDSKQLSRREIRDSYVIEGKLYHDYNTRCMHKVQQVPVESLEPEFVFARPDGDHRIGSKSGPQEILSTGFDPTKKTTIIVHGYSASYPKTLWMIEAREVFERYSLLGQQNLIFMDWNAASHGPYAKVASHSSIVGAYLSNFITKLTNLGADLGQMHLIGHSLGAHVSGFAGKRLQGKLGQISAMDAAGPCFKSNKVVSLGDRLMAGDAIVVDYYHYDDAFFGLAENLGTYDIYFNGGRLQPGCQEDLKSLAQLVYLRVTKKDGATMNISHGRPIEFIAMPLRDQKCQLVAYECGSFDEFLKGECASCGDQNERCRRLGFDFQYGESSPIDTRVGQTRRQMHIATGPASSLCLNTYQLEVTIELVHKEELSDKQMWLDIELVDQTGLTYAIGLSNLKENVYRGLVMTEGEPVQFVGARMQMIDRHNKQKDLYRSVGLEKSFVEHSYRLTDFKVSYMSHIEREVRDSLSSRLCATRWINMSAVKKQRKHHPKPEKGEATKSFKGSKMGKGEGWLELNKC